MRKILLIAPWLADFGHGIILTIITISIFDLEPSPIYFIFGILFSIAPDLDGLKEFLKSGGVGNVKDSFTDHRTGLHYPLLWLIAGLVFMYFDNTIGFLFLVCTMVHLINDSWGTGYGVQWLWPFSKNNYKFFFNGKVILVLNPEEKEKFMYDYADPNWVARFYAKPTKISLIEYGTFILGIVVLIFWIL